MLSGMSLPSGYASLISFAISACADVIAVEDAALSLYGAASGFQGGGSIRAAYGGSLFFLGRRRPRVGGLLDPLLPRGA